MKKYYIQLFLFVSPVIIIVFFGIFLLWYTGEFYTDEMIKQLHEDNIEFMYEKSYLSYADDPGVQIFKDKKPNIVVLGNSRVLQFRKEFFNQEFSFYNYSRIGTMKDLVEFWNMLKDNKINPEIIIVGLEQSYFLHTSSGGGGKNFTGLKNNKNFVGKKQSTTENNLIIITGIVRDILNGKINLVRLWKNRNSDVKYVGMAAAVLHQGIRRDGSRSYGDMVADYRNPKHDDYKFSQTFKEIEWSFGHYSQATDFSLDTISILENFLKVTSEKGIHVVAFLPPYAPSVFEKVNNKFKNNLDVYAYMKKIAPRLNNIFQKYEHSFFNLSDPEKNNLSDEHFIDGNHAAEPAYALITLYMSERDKLLGPYVDQEKILNALQLLDDKSEKELFH